MPDETVASTCAIADLAARSGISTTWIGYNSQVAHPLLGRRCLRRLIAYSRRAARSREDAAELIAEAVSRAWEAGLGVRLVLTADEVIPFLRKACVESVRVRRQEICSDVGHLADQRVEDADSAKEREERYQAAKRWLWDLPDQQRHAAWFRLLLGLRLAETAQAMNISLSATKTHYYRAIATLQLRACREATHDQVATFDQNTSPSSVDFHRAPGSTDTPPVDRGDVPRAGRKRVAGARRDNRREVKLRLVRFPPWEVCMEKVLLLQQLDTPAFLDPCVSSFASCESDASCVSDHSTETSEE